MKFNTAKIVIASVLFLTPFFSNAEVEELANKCVQREDQIATVPDIENFVSKLGGMRELEGSWKLSGVAGSFKKVIISFESANDGLKALIEGLKDDSDASEWGAIEVCDTVRPDTLLVRVLKSKDALYMRKGSGKSLELAQIENGKVGSFYTFQKIR